MSKRVVILGYVVVAAISVIGLWIAHDAQQLARDVDHRGDIRACQQENLIRKTSNDRDAKLEQTAKLTVSQIAILRHTKGDGSRAELNDLARQAKKIQVAFKPAKIVDCNKIFPGP